MVKQIALGLIFSVILMIIISMVFLHLAGKHAKKVIQSNPISLPLEDGDYKGAYYTITDVPAAKVQFAIQDGKMTNFWISRLLQIPPHRSLGKIQKSIGNQGLEFDAVSGATISSRFVKAAIVDAVKTKK